MARKEFMVDKLKVKVLDNPAEMGKTAAEAIRADILQLLKEQKEISVMFAAAPSQDTTLDTLKNYDDIPWNRINVFHMDEYVGISPNASQSFRNYLCRNFFNFFEFKSLNLINADNENYEKVAKDYDKLLKEKGIDLIILGIGESGHIAFNDPPEAKFTGESWTKIVKLSLVSRNQQVHDGCFAKLEDVPEYAVTVTIPAFLKAKKLHCVVPGKLKAEAVRKTILEPVSENCPASVLRKRDGATLYIEKDSASSL